MATTRTSAVKKPAAKKPAAKKSAAKKPVVKKPVAKPAVEKSASKKAVTSKTPAAKKPAVKKAAASKAPAAKMPAAQKAAASKSPAARKPAVAKSVSKAGATDLYMVEQFPAPPREIYSWYVEAHRQEQYTGAKCISEARVGGRFVAYDDYIRGKYIELEPGRRIVQEWSTTDWPPGAPPSRLELLLEAKGSGTELTMIHTGLPKEQVKPLKQGWQDFYWLPLRMLLEQKNK